MTDTDTELKEAVKKANMEIGGGVESPHEHPMTFSKRMEIVLRHVRPLLKARDVKIEELLDKLNVALEKGVDMSVRALRLQEQAAVARTALESMGTTACYCHQKGCDAIAKMDAVPTGK